MPYFIHKKNTPIRQTIDCRYTTAQSAHAALLAYFSPQTHKVTFQATPAENATWQEREKDRFVSGQYVYCPWENGYGKTINLPDACDSHFAHLSLKSPGLVAYTKSDEHGIADRQTTVKPGRYLQEFAPGLSASVRDRMIAECGSSYLELQIARDESTIKTIYMNGPSSCMDGAHWKQGEIISSVHPSAVYADCDLALAYFGTTDKPKARCIVWPDRKYHSRIYGDSERMRLLLETAGYTKANDFAGARIRAIRENNGFIMPYIDWNEHGTLSDCGRWIILDDDGEIDTQRTSGCTGRRSRDFDEDRDDDDPDDTDYRRCDRCNSRYDYSQNGSESYCESCEEHRMTCEHCDHSTDDRDYEFTEIAGSYYCEACTTAKTSTCEVCDGDFIEDNLTCDRPVAVRLRLCPSCAESRRVCQACDHVYEIHPSPWKPEDFDREYPMRGARLAVSGDLITWGTLSEETDRCPVCCVAARCPDTQSLFDTDTIPFYNYYDPLACRGQLTDRSGCCRAKDHDGICLSYGAAYRRINGGSAVPDGEVGTVRYLPVRCLEVI